MAITLDEAMGRIAVVQAALVRVGFGLGAYGPCGDGVDGRWGQASRAGWDNYLMSIGLSAATPEALVQLGITDVTMEGFQEAITVWNQWRNSMISSGTSPGTETYEATANAALAASTGITPETCPGMMPPPNGEVPANGVPNGNGMVPATMAPTEEKPFPWWVLGVVAIAVVGGGVAVWWFSKDRKGRTVRRASRATAMSGWGRGPEVTDEELGGGYEGYGKQASDQEDEED